MYTTSRNAHQRPPQTQLREDDHSGGSLAAAATAKRMGDDTPVSTDTRLLQNASRTASSACCTALPVKTKKQTQKTNQKTQSSVQATSRRWSRQSGSTARTRCASRSPMRVTRWTTPTLTRRCADQVGVLDLLQPPLSAHPSQSVLCDAKQRVRLVSSSFQGSRQGFLPAFVDAGGTLNDVACD